MSVVIASRKQCSKCKRLRPVAKFSTIKAHHGRKERLTSWCQECVADRQRPMLANENEDQCGVPECGFREARAGYCARHYKLSYRNGDPTLQKRATSTFGKSAAERKRFIAEFKMQLGCVDCGYTGPAHHLTFDHLPGTEKTKDIRSGQSLGWEALLAEIEKCEVVCWFCHIDRTMDRERR